MSTVKTIGSFLDPLELEFIDGEKWRVTAPFRYRIGGPDGAEEVDVCTGTITDFASIPRMFQNLLSPTRGYGKAAVLHDDLYTRRLVWTHDSMTFRLCTREEADNILMEAMVVLGVGWLTRHIIFRGVRVGGWVAWNKHRTEERKR